MLKIGNREAGREAGGEKGRAAPETPAPAAPTHVYVELSTRRGVITVPVGDRVAAQHPAARPARPESHARRRRTWWTASPSRHPGGRKSSSAATARSGSARWTSRTTRRSTAARRTSCSRDLTTMKVSRFVADVAGDLEAVRARCPAGDRDAQQLLDRGNTRDQAGRSPAGEAPARQVRRTTPATQSSTTNRSSSRCRRTILEEIWTDPLKWQDSKIQELKSEDIVALRNHESRTAGARACSATRTRAGNSPRATAS